MKTLTFFAIDTNSRNHEIQCVSNIITIISVTHTLCHMYMLCQECVFFLHAFFYLKPGQDSEKKKQWKTANFSHTSSCFR